MIRYNQHINHGSLFSGIGGFDLPAERVGWNNSFHCEINPFGRRVLKYYWPKAKSYEDITNTDFTIHKGELDVLSGGDPCQGNSVIGKREGTNYSGYLWPHQLRAVRESLPWFVVNENVRGSISNGILDIKMRDLENEGYTCWTPILCPASYFGAPHQRERVFLVAYLPERRLEGGYESKEKRQWKTETRSIEALVDNKDGFINPKSKFLLPNDGISSELDGITFSEHRKQSIMGYGNAVYTEAAFQIFKSIDQYIKSTWSNR